MIKKTAGSRLPAWVRGARPHYYEKMNIFLQPRQAGILLALILALVSRGFTAQTYRDGTIVKQILGAEVYDHLAPLDLAQAQAYGLGFERRGAELDCNNGLENTAHRGAVWTLNLNQTRATPVVATAWARSAQAGGAPASNYALYLDVLYQDGTTLWGQHSAFDPSLTTWHRRQVLVFPEKPIKSISYYLLYRHRAGQVYFKEPCFDTLEALDGVRFDGTTGAQLKPPQAGFLLRDVAQGQAFVAIEREALDTRLEVRVQVPQPDVTRYEVTLSDLSGQDRALTLIYTLPQAAGELRWCHDLRRSEVVATQQIELSNTIASGIGANGRLSLYPLGAVVCAARGVALGLDPTTPLHFRIALQPQTRELYLACDIGLIPKQSATFSFCTFNFKAADQFRGALARYYELFPDAFVTRIREQGVWMPFAKISAVEDWQDFGFRFKEGDNEPAWDLSHDILTFRYTEPLTWWMPLAPDVPRTLAQGETVARELAAKGHREAQAWVQSVFHDRHGAPVGLVRDTPWCNGVVWSMNSAPGVPGAVTDFSNKWSRADLRANYDGAAGPRFSGEYIDSAECYVTADLNFRREHFAASTRPLVYDQYTHRVGQYKGLLVFEYIRALERDMRARGHYMMANATPHRWFWLAPLLDVMGSEVNWKIQGRWQPSSDGELLYRRALCRGKPYCFLMNTDFQEFTYADSERFMQRALAYGMFPGYFSADASTGHYFSQPALYNRDRPLFKKYVPLCQKLATAGWEPLTRARSDNDQVTLERFGHAPGTCYWTVFNHATNTQTARITFDAPPSALRELVVPRALKLENQGLTLSLPPESVRVLEAPARL